MQVVSMYFVFVQHGKKGAHCPVYMTGAGHKNKNIQV